jgi:hypothetical protein
LVKSFEREKPPRLVSSRVGVDMVVDGDGDVDGDVTL